MSSNETQVQELSKGGLYMSSNLADTLIYNLHLHDVAIITTIIDTQKSGCHRFFLASGALSV